MKLSQILLARGQLNYWQRYVERVMQREYLSRLWHPLAGWKEQSKKNWHYGEHRPWTADFLKENKERRAMPRMLLEPIKNWKIFKGDRVGHPLRSLARQFSSTTMQQGPSPKEGVLLGLGNPLLDITVVADEKFLKKYKLKPNDAIIGGRDQEGLIVDMMHNFKPHYQAGGATQNSIRVAQWLLQKPNCTVFFGGVGCDNQAEILRKKAQDAGVNVRYSQSKSAPTGTCAAIITNEDRSLVAHLGAADFFTHEWLEKKEQWDVVEKASVYYVGGFLFPVCNQTIFDIAKHASSHSKTLVMNLSAPFLCKYYADDVHNIMQHIDVLFGNENEAKTFCDLKQMSCSSVEEMALAVAKLPKVNESKERIVVFTQGREPVIVAKGNDLSKFEVSPVEHSRIKDTTGCGDAFVGGFLAELVRGKSLEDCIKRGIYASQVVMEHWGCNYPQTPKA